MPPIGSGKKRIPTFTKRRAIPPIAVHSKARLKSLIPSKGGTGGESSLEPQAAQNRASPAYNDCGQHAHRVRVEVEWAELEQDGPH